MALERANKKPNQQLGIRRPKSSSIGKSLSIDVPGTKHTDKTLYQMFDCFRLLLADVKIHTLHQAHEYHGRHRYCSMLHSSTYPPMAHWTTLFGNLCPLCEYCTPKVVFICVQSSTYYTQWDNIVASFLRRNIFFADFFSSGRMAYGGIEVPMHRCNNIAPVSRRNARDRCPPYPPVDAPEGCMRAV